MSFWRPKPGTILRYDGSYRNWLNDLLDQIDRWQSKEPKRNRFDEEHIMVGSVFKEGQEFVRVVNQRGIEDVAVSGGMDIDLALIRRPILVGGGMVILLTVAVIYAAVGDIIHR